MNTPSGAGDTSPGPHLEEMDREECLRLLATGQVGRVAFNDGEGPAVVPVNYTVDGESVVFRTTFGGRINRSLTTLVEGADVRIAFEVDHLNEDRREGWSVMVRGGAHHLSAEEVAQVPRPDAWAGGERESHFRITPRQISGRRVRQN